MALLEGKNAVVTGGTRGIGLGIAVELAREGARVLVCHRGGHPEKEKEALEVVARAGRHQPILCTADMTQEKDARYLADTALEKLGRIDIWVNNVGRHTVTPALTQSGEEWEQLQRVNTTSAFLGCREAARVMLTTGGGSIINIASKMGIAGSAENACYCSAKAAVIMMTQCLAAEWAAHGIRVNVIAPGVTLTDPTFAVVAGRPAVEAALHYRTPLGRFAEPSEIGKVAVFLASGLSSYVTGTVICCDGGWTGHGDFAGIPPEKLDEWHHEFPRLERR